jgi:D-alanine--poly(phosphoribitol) ligase subunit 1
MIQLNLAFPVYSYAQLVPSRAALWVDDRLFTYQDLATEAGGVAAWIRDCAVKDRRCPRVGILAARSLEAYAGLLGTAWLGGMYIPLNPRQPAARLRTILQCADLDALIVDRRGAVHLGDLATALPAHVLIAEPAAVDWGGRKVVTWATLARRNLPALPPLAVAVDHPAYVIFTSGTTGVPKGVVVTVANVAHFLACIRAQYHIGPEDRVGQFSESSFDVSIFEMFACWHGGAALHVVPETKLMAPAGFIQQQRLTVWASVPAVIALAMRMNHLVPGAFPTLRISYFAGEGLPLESAKAWQLAAPNSVVDNQYGPTEGTITCIWQRLGDPAAVTPGRGTLAIGRPYPGMAAGIVDTAGNFLGPDEVGELALCGPQVATGYLNDAAQTARRFPTLQHPELGPSRWYLTGDRASCDEANRFHCLGRVDNQVKVLGNRVELEEIEAHLRTICGTDAVAAVAWPTVNGNAVGIVAFVAGSRVDAAATREELRRRLPGYMVPRKVVPLEVLPLSANGKVDRQRLRTLLDEQATDARP